ncbi:MAG TPA: hypothetical protein VD861_02540 [Pyrinomonadaceae bacterium]|nr:hypothetical protein [Pyrinomonadaceae bacterium]
MVTLLITSFLLLAGITYAVYLWQRPSSKEDAPILLQPPPGGVSLFGDEAGEPAPRELADGKAAEEEERRALLSRAGAGDKGALEAAHATGDAALYDEVLNALVERADSDKTLLALVSHVSRSDARLRVNRRLAEKFMESWKSAPDRNSTMKMLHVAAVANDAGLYRTAIETAYQFWRDRRLTGISADELRQLIEGEFWLLAPEVRNSGAGFVLKRTLARLRKQLVNRES